MPVATDRAEKFTDLVVWQKAHAFVLTVYRVTQTFPREEMYGLTSQFRRAAVSIAANIAEGFKKRSNRDKAHFANIAESSLEECRYYVILAADLGYTIDSDELLAQVDEIGRMLHGYARSLRQKEQ
jgi:four helix bundle protein